MMMSSYIFTIVHQSRSDILFDVFSLKVNVKHCKIQDVPDTNKAIKKVSKSEN